MPPNQKITKEMILETGYKLVSISGIESVNSRSIAKMLCCSTQPVFSQFPGMEELKQSVHNYACQKFEQDVLCTADFGSFFRSSYLKVTNLAKNENNIFKLIYLSEYCLEDNFLYVLTNFKSYQRIQKELMEKYQINDKDCIDVLERISLLVQGIATLIATSNIHYTDEQIIDIVERTLEDIIKGTKERSKII
ncbi:MAG TPA: TetR/AcrR family transcriptional regulator [Clostridia bacterium]|nr:TetR/AcrR family transcriptional regulator [Clostridia bacterium]